MADSGSCNRVLNFWRLHFQKLGLELKCSLCLKTLNQPMLLPCDHIFCSTCIPNSVGSGSNCPICYHHYLEKDLRRTLHMENILSIYKSMEAALHTLPFQSATQTNTTGEQFVGDQNHGGGLNQMTQSSPCSPPSFCETKDSDDDGNCPGGQHSAKRSSSEGTTTKENDMGKVAKNCAKSNTSDEDDHARETKRQRLEFGLPYVTPNGATHILPEHLIAENGLSSKSEIRHMPKKHVSQKSPTLGSLHATPTFICAFCQSSEVSEVYGPMLHYKNGKPVQVDKINQPDVQHAHRRCIEWTPQVYYEGETAMNLGSELARAAKLKCHRCKLKGAALGCYAKSCQKSFHVPCAVSIDECRWDTDNFLMLCPSHSSQKFPSERSNSKKASQQTKKVWEALLGTEAWVICGSDLSSSEKDLLVKFGKISGATILKAWNPNVTHVIAATDENGAFCRTLKVLMGILYGRWILNIDWIHACMDAMCPVNEEPYEVKTDVHGCQDGPKKGRLRIMEEAPKLFTGLCFCFSDDFEPSYKGYLEELVEVAGGAIYTKEMLHSQGPVAEAGYLKSLIVYNVNFPPESGDLVKKHRREEADRLAFRTESWVVGHTWILESIAAVNLQPFSS